MEERTHHLVQGVAQEAVLVEDEEPALPFLQQNTEDREGSGPPPHEEPLRLTGLPLRPAGSTASTSGAPGWKSKASSVRTGPARGPNYPACLQLLRLKKLPGLFQFASSC